MIRDYHINGAHIEFNDEAHIYRVDGVVRDSITQMLEAEGLTDFAAVSPYVLKAAQQFGTAVHAACEYWDRGTLSIDQLDPKLVPYLDGWVNFKKDFGFEIEDIERVVWHRSLRYPGRLDRVGILKDGPHRARAVIEIKSSTSMHAATAIQTELQRMAWRDETKKPCALRWGVQLTSGGYCIEPYDNPGDEGTATALVLVHQFKVAHKLIRKAA